MGTRLDLPPPGTISDAGGGGSDWIELLKANNDIDAHLIVGRLGESGIETRTIKDRSGPAWLHGGSDPWAPVAVWVKRYQLDDARIVLAEVSFSGPDAEPEQVAQRAGPNFVLWWALALALGLLFTGIALMNTYESFQEECKSSTECSEG